MFKILIIDDTLQKTQELMKYIEECHFQEVEVDYETEYKKSCERLTKEYFDLVVLDIQLPSIEIEGGMSIDGGVKLLNLIFEVDFIKKPLSIIGLTAFDENYDNISNDFNRRLCHLIKYDRTCEGWKRQICEKIAYLIEAKKMCLFEEMQLNSHIIDCVIITAVKVEFDAVYKLGQKWEKKFVEGDPTQYYFGEVICGEKTIKIVLVRQNQMGMVAASMLTTKLVENFSPKLICMLGIAAGCEGEVDLGDIIVACESWDYGSGKIESKSAEGGFVLKPDPHQIAILPAIKEVMMTDFSDKLYEIRKTWNDSNGERKTQDISLHIGPMASGSAVVQDEKIVTEFILPQNRKAIGIDMETYAVYYAASNAKKMKPAFLSIKAVSDFANKHKNDGYQSYAAYVSAKFFFTSIQQILECIGNA